MRLLPLFLLESPSLKGQLQRLSTLDTSIPFYSDLLEPDAPCPARGGHRVAAGPTCLKPFQRLKGSKLASLGAWSAVHSRHLASHVVGPLLAFRLWQRCLVVDKNPVPHCLWSARVAQQLLASTCEDTSRFNHCSAGRGFSTGRNGMSPHHRANLTCREYIRT